jgi:glycosyltransferase involved in cell wall biosynthesis
MRANVTGAHHRFASLMAKADRVIAVCQWVKDVLIANGVPERKVALCRQGFGGVSNRPPRQATGPAMRRAEGPLRFAYFGRIDPVKGLDIVVDALRLIPDMPVVLHIYGMVQPGCESYASRLKTSPDARVQFIAPMSPGEVGDAMAKYDFIVVPSRWLETGPLVVYESFAAGTPVLGSRLGGIAELVSDGVDGILVSPDNPNSWANIISGLARDITRVDRLRAGIRPPRTMKDVADEMAEIYSNLRLRNVDRVSGYHHQPDAGS